jgi:hypothetical protein
VRAPSPSLELAHDFFFKVNGSVSHTGVPSTALASRQAAVACANDACTEESDNRTEARGIQISCTAE